MAASREKSSQTLLSSVLDTLGMEIVSGAQPVGYTFTLHDISERFSISRTVAREAMRALEQLGLVSSSRRVGLKVLPLSEWDVFDHSVISWRLHSENQREAQIASLRELRDAIEPAAARLAAANATPDQATQLKELAETIVQLADEGAGYTEPFLEADTTFHALILQASRNEMFSRLAAPIIDMMHGRTTYGMLPEKMSMETMRLHINLAEAIAQGDGRTAEETSRSLLTGVNDFVEM
ncbi:FadR/GntR family transcriptional regulator [Corynebacterium sp. Marseille-P4321]|uniref:FadR/GntR family transcriptional regulator n=1 Tax=Corynebacterium sp. Marseille-P4321 TaxID=2736603 RepID=UPI0015891D9A|nr:FCD domain-containing protein [Corynebacterium sp. Marseille-P4321]